MSTKNKKIWVIAGKIIFIATACYLLWRAIDVNTMVALFNQISLTMFSVAVLVCILDKMMMGYKWSYLLRPFGVTVPLSAPIIANLRAKVFQYFTPTTLGEDAYKAYYLRRRGADLAATLSSIFIERVIGIFSSLAMIGLFVNIPLRQFSIPYATLIGVVGIAAFIAITIILALMIRFSDRLPQFAYLYWLPHKLKYSYNKFRIVVARARSGHRDIWYFYVLSLVEKIAYGSAIYFSAKAVGIDDLEYVYFIAAAPLLALLERLPVTVSAIGVREGLMVVLMKPYVVDPTVPVAIALVFRAAELSMTVLCLFVWFLGNHNHKDLENMQQVNREIVQINSEGLKADH